MMKNARLLLVSSLLIMFYGITAYGQVPPTLYSPTNGSNCVNILADMDWSDVPNAVSYKLEISDDPDFTNLIVDFAGLTETNITVTLPNWNSLYYWRATSVFANNNTGVSGVWTFTTKFVPLDLVYPVNDQQCADTLIAFKWHKADAEFYTLQVASDINFDTLVYNKNNLTDTTVNVKLSKYSQSYFWRVASKKGLCQTEFSNIWHLVTKHAPPVQLKPLSGTLGGELFAIPPFSVNLIWDKININDSYDIQISKRADFSDIYDENYNFTDTNYIVTIPTEYDSTYYWRVRSTRNGCTSYWSNAFSFKSPYTKTTLVEPVQGEVCVTMRNTPFKWTILQGVSKYRLQVSDTISFSRLLIDTANILDRQIKLNLTLPLKTHYWRVRGDDSRNTGLWSDIHSFVTTQRPPVVISPLNGTIGLQKNIDFIWESFGTNVLYELEVYADKELQVRLLDTAGLDTNNFNFTVPNDNSEYFWQVRVFSDGCIGDWTAINTFRTLIPSPVLLKPADKSVKTTLYPIYEWAPVVDALTYEIEISSDSLFKKIFLTDRNIQSVTWTMPGLQYAEMTKYWWRVRAKNNDGNSMWSNPFTFTTRELPATAPLLLSPANHSVKIDMNPTLKWHPSFKAVSYVVTVSANDNFTDIFVTQGTADTTLDIVGLERFTTYWWKVQAIGSEGQGGISTIFNFRTKDIAPDKSVALISPLDNVINQGLIMTFKWNSIERALAYHLQIADNNDYAESSIVQDHPSVKDTMRVVSDLEYNKTYYWRVAGWNEDGQAGWSAVRQFKTSVNASVRENDLNISSLAVYPNPAKGITNFVINAANTSTGSLRIVNVLGMELIRMDNVELNNGENIISVDLKLLQTGMYIYSYETATGITTGKIVIE